MPKGLIRGSILAALFILSFVVLTPDKGNAILVNGTYNGITRDVQISLTVTASGPAQDFTVGTTQPSSAPANGYTTTESTIRINSLYGFNGTVTLDDRPLPSGLACGAITPYSVTISGAATLSCESSIPGSYSVTVTGTSTGTNGPLVRTSKIAFAFTSVLTPDFSVSASPASAVADGSTAAVSTINVNSFNGFAGTVTLSDNPPSELSCQPFTHQTIATLGESLLSCTSLTPGIYPVTITGTDSGSLTSTSAATFTFTSQPPPSTPDVSLVLSDSSISINTGASASTTLTISPQNGFTGSIRLSASGANGVSCSLSHTNIQTSGTSTLTCNGIAPGDYIVTITATGGASPHSKTVIVHVIAQSPVAPAPSSSSILGLAPSVFYTVIAIITIAALAVVIITVRPTRSRSKFAS